LHSNWLHSNLVHWSCSNPLIQTRAFRLLHPSPCIRTLAIGPFASKPLHPNPSLQILVWCRLAWGTPTLTVCGVFQGSSCKHDHCRFQVGKRRHGYNPKPGIGVITPHCNYMLCNTPLYHMEICGNAPPSLYWLSCMLSVPPKAASKPIQTPKHMLHM
jgi:hypothetical protein